MSAPLFNFFAYFKDCTKRHTPRVCSFVLCATECNFAIRASIFMSVSDVVQTDLVSASRPQVNVVD